MNGKKEQALFEHDAKLLISEATPMGLQHVVAAVVRTITSGITIAKVYQLSPSDATILVQTSLIFSAVITLIQPFPIFREVGPRSPVMMGTSFTYVPILMAVGTGSEIVTILGSQPVDSILVIIIGLFIKRIRVLFPPLVTGTVILGIRLSLFPVAVKYIAGGAGSADFGSARNWLVALLAFTIVFYFDYFAKGFLELSVILNGMVIDYLISLALGMASFEPAQNVKIVQAITPFHFGPDFQLVPTFTLVTMLIADAVQAIGQFTATTVGVMDWGAADEELSGGIMESGFANFIGSLFGSIPVATFEQSAGPVTVTKVINKYILAFASVILLIAGFTLKIAMLLTTIPYAVTSDAAISTFASIFMTSIRMTASQEMTPRSIGVTGTALAFGIGVTSSTGSLAGFPTWVITIFGSSEATLTTLVAVLLNVILEPKKRVALE